MVENVEIVGNGLEVVEVMRESVEIVEGSEVMDELDEDEDEVFREHLGALDDVLGDMVLGDMRTVREMEVGVARMVVDKSGVEDESLGDDDALLDVEASTDDVVIFVGDVLLEETVVEVATTLTPEEVLTLPTPLETGLHITAGV